MTQRRKLDISLRKVPQQARSAGMVALALEAAVQVLTKHGAARFTMARVAERAGVSVGSLYQYFPNKAAILFRLQCDEWQQTSAMLHTLLTDGQRPPLERLRVLVRAFVRSECDEAAIRMALGDAAPMYRDAPETKRARASGQRALRTFMREVLPGASEQTRRLAGGLITTTLGAVGKEVSETAQSVRVVDRYATALSDMFCAYLEDLNRPRTTRGSAARDQPIHAARLEIATEPE